MDIILNFYYFLNILFSPIGILIITVFIPNKKRNFNLKEKYALTFVKLFKFTLVCLIINVLLVFHLSPKEDITSNFVTQIIILLIIVEVYRRLKRYLVNKKILPTIQLKSKNK